MLKLVLSGRGKVHNVCHRRGKAALNKDVLSVSAGCGCHGITWSPETNKVCGVTGTLHNKPCLKLDTYVAGYMCVTDVHKRSCVGGDAK